MIYKILKPLAKVFLNLIFRIKIEGRENLPKGAFIICINHLSNWDPVFFLTHFKRKIRFLGKQELFKNAIIRKVVTAFGMIPVKRGQADMTAIKTSISVLNNGEILGIFPSGTRNKIIKKGQAKSGVALIGARCGAKLVPVSIKSNYRLFSKVHIKIGEYLDLSQYKGQKLESEKLQEIADNVYDKIVEMYEEA